MYVPDSFKVEDPALLAEVMRRFSFATVVCAVDNEVLTSHLPLVFDSERHSLFGHFAGANDHWRALEVPRKTTAIFHGSHAYISPTMYETRPNVPTWAYTVVHAHGVPRLLDLDESTDQIIAMVGYFDPKLADTHPESIERDFVRKKARGIVAFEMPIESLEGKFKVGQNKVYQDRKSAGEALVKSDDPLTREIGRLYLSEGMSL